MKLEDKNHEQSSCFLFSRLVQQAPVQYQTYTRNSQTLAWI